MHRDEIRRDVMAYLDGEGDKEFRARIKRALETDPELAQERDELLALNQLLDRHPVVDPSPTFGAGALARATPSRPRRFPWRIAAAALVAASLVAAFVLTPPWNEKDEPAIELEAYGVFVPPQKVQQADGDLQKIWDEIQWIEDAFLPMG